MNRREGSIMSFVECTLPGMRLAVAVVAPMVLCSCGDVDVRVVLRSLLTAEESSSIVTLSAVVSKDGEELARSSRSLDGSPLTLPSVDWTKGVEVYVAGLTGAGALRAYGSAAPELPAEPASCCVIVCLCGAALHDQGVCTCGRHQCSSNCTP